MEMTVEKPLSLDTANVVLNELQELEVGESVRFEPALPETVADVLYLLLEKVDKGWRIEPGKQRVSFWKSLFTPCDLFGRSIPQTISSITRMR